MVNPKGIVAMLVLLLSSGTALADNHISKDDVKQITFTKKSIIFRMNDDTYYRGDYIRPHQCDIQKGQRYAFRNPNRISNEFVIIHREGFRNCRFSDVERIA